MPNPKLTQEALASAFPLQWPMHKPRTPAGGNANQAAETTAAFMEAKTYYEAAT